MYCTQCGTQMGEDFRYCPQCGRVTGVGGPPPAEHPERLMRDISNKKIAGVCAGFARYLSVDVVLIRVIWLALAFGTGLGFIAYAIAWIIMPKDESRLVRAGEPVRQN